MLKTEWSYPVDIWNVGVMVRICRLLATLSNMTTANLHVRYGICSKGDTSFTAVILTTRTTQRVTTWPR